VLVSKKTVAHCFVSELDGTFFEFSDSLQRVYTPVWRARLMPFGAEKFFFQMKTGHERHNPVFSIRIGQGERVSTHRQIRLW
jgi:hypothetical protein